MGFSDAIDNAMDVWFGDDFADAVVLNSVAVNAQVIEQGVDESSNGMAGYIDVDFKLTDYGTIAYRTDTLVYGGLTWRYPKKRAADADTVTVRFSRNVRPRA